MTIESRVTAIADGSEQSNGFRKANGELPWTWMDIRYGIVATGQLGDVADLRDLMSVDNSLKKQRCTESGSAGVDDGSAKVAGARDCFSAPVFWLLAWLGTMAAGGVYGALEGGVAGLVVGAILAGIFGIPIGITMAATTWLLWLSRFCVAMSAIAGALTGAAATVVTWESYLRFPLYVSILLASIIGGLGSALGSGLYRARYTRWSVGHRLLTDSCWRFSLRDLLMRVTIVAAPIGAWAWLGTSIYKARSPVSIEEVRCRFEQHAAEFNQLVLMLRQDRGLHAIHRDGSYDRKIIDRQRAAEYRDLLRRAHLANSLVCSAVDGDDHRVSILPDRASRDGVRMEYVYSTTRPPRVVESVTDADADSLGRGESVYATLGDNWCLFVERPDYSD